MKIENILTIYDETCGSKNINYFWLETVNNTFINSLKNTTIWELGYFELQKAFELDESLKLLKIETLFVLKS